MITMVDAVDEGTAVEEEEVADEDVDVITIITTCAISTAMVV